MVDFSKALWRKSTHSLNNGCVEVAFVDGQVGVRDSKDPDGPALVFTASEWEAFIAGARDGEFEPPFHLGAASLPRGRGLS
jgi:hypothetical protein